MLRVSLLGEQSITDDQGGSVRAWSSRAVVLVAFLVVHAGSAQARPRIAGLWPESTDAQALTNLRRELHHLRQVLADEPSLVVTSRDLRWDDTKTCRVDVRVFDTERKAAQAAARPPMIKRESCGMRPRRSPRTGVSCCRVCTKTGCWTPERSLSGSAWSCATCSPRPGREPVTWPGRCRRPGAGSSFSPWRRSATAP